VPNPLFDKLAGLGGVESPRKKIAPHPRHTGLHSSTPMAAERCGPDKVVTGGRGPAYGPAGYGPAAGLSAVGGHACHRRYLLAGDEERRLRSATAIDSGASPPGVTGVPGTASTEIMEFMLDHQAKARGPARPAWSVNERDPRTEERHRRVLRGQGGQLVLD